MPTPYVPTLCTFFHNRTNARTHTPFSHICSEFSTDRMKALEALETRHEKRSKHHESMKIQSTKVSMSENRVKAIQALETKKKIIEQGGSRQRDKVVQDRETRAGDRVVQEKETWMLKTREHGDMSAAERASEASSAEQANE